MADNFDLRQFLTENKLTKNAKLLKEEINSNVEDIAGAFDEAGLTGMVTVLFQSDSSMGEPDISTMPAERAMKSIIRKAANAESVMVAQGSEIRKGEQIGDYEEETEGLECKVVVEILDKGVYEIYQGSNSLNEGSDYGYDDLMDVVDTEYDGDPTIARAVEDAFHKGDIDTSEFSHDPSAPSKAVAQIVAAHDFGPAQHGNETQFEGADYDPDNEEFEDDEPFTGRYVSSRDIEEEVEEGIHDRNILSRPLSNPGIEPLDQSPEELGKAADARSENILRMTYRNQIQDPNISDEELKYILSGKGVKGFGGTPNAIANILASRSRMEEAKSYKVSKNSKEAQHLKKGDIIGSGEEVVSVSAGAKTPSGKIEVTLKTKDGKTKTSTWGKTTKVGVKEKETVKENTMTERDKYLTRLVENALGLQVTEDDNVDYTMGNQDDPNQLPNPAPELNIPEGDEMVQEKPLPKYENIEKLMQEIDKSTDEEAHKFKMQEMKRVADMLEKKCTALEEGDDADHIDQKKLKQMKKDVMALRKNIEKMEKLGEKKFTKKETKADLKEGFDLRNFLVENKLTTNSKLINEEVGSIMYNIFKSKEDFKYRRKVTAELVEKLAQISREKGLNVEEDGLWAWKEGSEEMEWKYVGGYLYYDQDYAGIINALQKN
jgi:hypothetical protein